MEYDADFLEQINNGVNLLEYAESTGFEFEHKGKEHFCSCPLHVDKTPSLCISDANPQKFYCFSCNKGGGIIRWLQCYEGLRFHDAVEKAAKLAGADLSAMCQSPVVLFMKKQKRSMPTAKKSTEHKELAKEEFERFTICDIPEWESEGIPKEILRIFDVRVDERSNRIVYPVFDAAGRLINIKGRTRYENYKNLRLPKYINYYPVGDMDYFQGFREAEPYIRETGEVIICESVKSVMKCWAWGIKNVISAESHSITDKQLRLLVKLGANLVIAFDNDVIKTYYTDKGRALREQFSKLAKFTGVYVIMNGDGLGEKDAPMDKGKEVFLELYGKKRRWR